MLRFAANVGELLRKPAAIAVLASLGGSLVTLGVTRFNDFSSSNRAAVETAFAKLNDTSQDFFQILSAYSNRARTGANLDEQTQKQFREAILRLYSQSEAIAKRQPKVSGEFNSYAASLLQLQDAAEKMKTPPLDARPFVEAASAYLDSESKLKSKISEMQTSFLSSLF